jgi:DNA invertase Pin-like site-specific DNA recombinase
MRARAAIYARVSTGEQSTEQQVTALREAADRMRLDPVLVVEETGSGAKADRPGLLRVMDAARCGEVRAVLFWKFDRLGRSVLDLARDVDELRRAGVRLVAVTQAIDLDPERPDAAAKMAADMLAAVAEYEWALIIERTRAGLDRARRKGTKSGRPIGRPRASQVLLHAARDLVAAGVPVAEAARRKGVARSTLQRFIRVSGA